LRQRFPAMTGIAGEGAADPVAVPELSTLHTLGDPGFCPAAQAGYILISDQFCRRAGNVIGHDTRWPMEALVGGARQSSRIAVCAGATTRPPPDTESEREG
jgi:hypothetical protein